MFRKPVTVGGLIVFGLIKTIIGVFIGYHAGKFMDDYEERKPHKANLEEMETYEYRPGKLKMKIGF